MATTMAKCCCKLIQVTTGLKHLHTSHIQHGNTILRRSLWSGSIFGAKNTRSMKEIKEPFPGKPKQPANVFIQFLQKVTPQLQKENPAATRTEIVSRASSMWKELDPEEKSRLAMDRREAYDKYKEDLRTYMENITPEQVMEAERRKRLKTEQNLKKARQSLGMPAKPLGAFSSFISEKFTERSDEPVPVYFKQVIEQWKTLSDSEKQKYYEKAQEAKSKYVKDIVNWEKEMMALGRYDVVRKSTLKELGRKNKTKRKRSSQKSSKDDHDL